LLGLEGLDLQSESQAEECVRSIRLYTTQSLLNFEDPGGSLAVEVQVKVEAEVGVVV
jgi:hypothetical protein